MENKTYNLLVGVILLAASFGFFLLPLTGKIDSFIPVIFSILLLISAVVVLVSGFAKNK